MTVKVVLILLQRKAITQLQDLRRKRTKVVFGVQRKQKIFCQEQGREQRLIIPPEFVHPQPVFYVAEALKQSCKGGYFLNITKTETKLYYRVLTKE
jgi:hypothetical protein